MITEMTPSETMFKDDCLAHALYEKMFQTMHRARTMYYESEYLWETKGKELGHSVYKLWMRKPNYARLEAMEDGKLTGVLIGDGDYFWIHWPSGRPRYGFEDVAQYEQTCFNAYMKIPTPLGKHSIAHMTDKLGTSMSMTIVEPSVFHGYAAPMEQYLDGVRSVGSEVVGLEGCDLIEASFMDHQRSRYLWISKSDCLPRKLKEVVRVEYDITTHELWSNVTVDGEAPIDKFQWKPPEDWQEWRLPSLEQGLLEPGAKAPGFELSSLDGGRIRLSDYSGRVIWLVFWRVGCQPCREEVLHLERVYKEHKDRRLVVLGFNCADDKQKVSDFLKKNAVTFPNIVDSSDGAKKTYFTEYQTLRWMSAVPLNYVIDRRGNVADAWYGYDEERAENVLERLAIRSVDQ